VKTTRVHRISQEQLPKALMNAAHLCMLQLTPTTSTTCHSVVMAETILVPPGL